MNAVQFLAAFRSRSSDLTTYCFVTSFALGAVALTAFVLNQLGVTWPATGLLLAAAGLYFALGVVYFAQDLLAAPKAAPLAQAPLCQTAPHFTDADSDYTNDFAESSSAREREEVGAGV